MGNRTTELIVDSTTAAKPMPISIATAHFDAEMLHARLTDDREFSVPLGWFPSLRDADAAQRNNWRLIGGGTGIHWEDLDEDLSVERLLRC